MPRTLADAMSIHTEIKRLRLAKGWSHQRLADEISKIEGDSLSWQTVQQWEKTTAPKRVRLENVARLLGTTPAALMSGGGPQSFSDLHGPEAQLVMFYRQLGDAGGALLELVAEVFGQPEAKRLEAVNAARAVASNPGLLAQLASKAAAVGVEPTREHQRDQGMAPRKTRKSTSQHSGK